jgi:hypothetical protein
MNSRQLLAAAPKLRARDAAPVIETLLIEDTEPPPVPRMNLCLPAGQGQAIDAQAPFGPFRRPQVSRFRRCDGA